MFMQLQMNTTLKSHEPKIGRVSFLIVMSHLKPNYPSLQNVFQSYNWNKKVLLIVLALVFALLWLIQKALGKHFGSTRCPEQGMIASNEEDSQWHWSEDKKS